MSDEYHTPKDLVNKQPLTIGLEVFKKNDGTVESYGSESFQRLNHTPSGDPTKVFFLNLINDNPNLCETKSAEDNKLFIFFLETTSIRSYLQRT